MLKAVSPLGADALYESEGLALKEAGGFTLTQVSGNDRALRRELGFEPEFGKVSKGDGRIFVPINGNQVWVVGEEPDVNTCMITPLSSSRCRIVVQGGRARNLLAACSAIDFDKSAFKSGHYAMTIIHHTPVLIHCTGSDTFHIYAMRTFAKSTWDWLVDAAKGVHAD